METPQRILVIRLDRIGDVVLSTPVVRALREAYPSAFIAMMVRPACREVLEGHPAVNQVIVYEKEGRHHSLLDTIRFAVTLRRQRFDVALALHPTNRSHWIAWLAGIPRRIGYSRKCGWLLTDRLPHRKQEGARHEAAYTLELLRPLGLQPTTPKPFVALTDEADRRVAQWLQEHGVTPADRLIAVHPSASCPSKRWLLTRFAQVADQLIESTGARIILVAGVPEAADAKAVADAMRHPSLNAAGLLSVGELACLLARCRLLLSNDSGPVHIAAAVGVPVVAIFGRNQRGLSAGRWGPLGEGHLVLQKEVGCVHCLAHDCPIHFLCLTSLTANEVFEAARRLLQ